MTLRNAVVSDAPVLTAIAFAAKRHWGYPEHWLAQWREVLTITPEYIEANPCFVASDEAGTPVAFASVRWDGASASIDHLWVLPQAMRMGIGRRLFERCEAVARAAGATELRIEADPNAAAFYERMGAVIVGRVDASIDGVERHLPLMVKTLRSSMSPPPA